MIMKINLHHRQKYFMALIYGESGENVKKLFFGWVVKILVEELLNPFRNTV